MTNIEPKTEPRWMHYHSIVENLPASIEFDKALLEKAPIESLNILTSLSIELTQKNETGLLEDDDEIDLIEKVTDTLAEQIQEGGRALLAGNIQADNALIYYIYSNDASHAEKRAKSIIKKYEQYSHSAQLESTEDPGWEFFLESLAPNSETDKIQVMVQEAEEKITEDGKHPDRKGKVLYSSLFPNEKQAQKYIGYIEKKGVYTLENQSQDAEGQQEVTVSKTELLRYGNIIGNVDNLKMLAKDFKGKFKEIEIASSFE